MAAKQIHFTKEFKKECERAAWEYSGKHFWGDKGNAGVNYVPRKNAEKSASKDS